MTTPSSRIRRGRDFVPSAPSLGHRGPALQARTAPKVKQRYINDAVQLSASSAMLGPLHNPPVSAQCSHRSAVTSTKSS